MKKIIILSVLILTILIFMTAQQKCTSAVVPKNCQEYFKKGTIISGTYPIDPEGDGSSFMVYCDMSTAGGGWTLALKIDGTKTTFTYDASLWTNNLTYNTDKYDYDYNEAKLATYHTVPFQDILLKMVVNNVTRSIVVPYVANSLLAVIGDNNYRATSIGRNEWKKLIDNSSLQPNCNREGFNTRVSNYAMARIGIIANQENDCNSPDSRLGFGTAGNNCSQNPNNSCGNEARCSADNGDRSIQAFGYVFVR